MVASLFRGFDFSCWIGILLVCWFGDHVFVPAENYFLIDSYLGIIVVSVLAMIPDYRFLRLAREFPLFTYYSVCYAGFFGEVTLGAQSRFDVGFFYSTADPAKLALACLAKFSKRHEANWRL